MDLTDRAVHPRKRPLLQSLLRRRLHNPAFTIISSNCWGSSVYEDLGLGYTTPFVGLMLYAPCYLRLLADLRGYLAAPLRFIAHSRYDRANQVRASRGAYPLALLGDDIEVHFFHYHSPEEAESKWARRCGRIHWDNLFVSFTDKDLCTKEMLVAFDRLPYEHKVCFTAHPYPDVASSIWIKECAGEPFVTDIYTNRGLVRRHFDVIDWLNGGTGQTSWIRRQANLVLTGL